MTDTAPRSRNCRRCAGSGTVSGGACFRCEGIGIDPGPRPRVVVSPEVIAENRTLDALRRVAATRGVADKLDTMYAAQLLKDREPARYARMLASVDAGRTDAVIDALLAYYR